MTRIILIAKICIFLFFVATNSTAAKELSATEIEYLFQGQIFDLGAARSFPDEQKELHRGLVLVPGSDGGQSNLEEIEFLPADTRSQVNIKIVFDVDSAILRPDQRAVLSPVCEAIKKLEQTLFQVIGHTDGSGTEAHNDNLSVWRAEAIRTHLVEDCGIEGTRLKAVGVGERYLFDASNPFAEINRRVEFQAVGSF